MSVVQVLLGSQRCSRRLFGLLAASTLACAPPTSSRNGLRSSTPQGAQVSFAYLSQHGDRLNSSSTRGRATLLVFVTTFDLAAQMTVRRVQELARSFTPRINAGAIVMEAPRYDVLLPTFKAELGLSFPVVMADYPTLNGEGPFGAIKHIPTIVVLDKSGRERARLLGPAELKLIRAALRSAS